MAKKCIHGATVGACGFCGDEDNDTPLELIQKKNAAKPKPKVHVKTTLNTKPPHNRLRQEQCTCNLQRDHSVYGRK